MVMRDLAKSRGRVRGSLAQVFVDMNLIDLCIGEQLFCVVQVND